MLTILLLVLAVPGLDDPPPPWYANELALRSDGREPAFERTDCLAELIEQFPGLFETLYVRSVFAKDILFFLNWI